MNKIRYIPFVTISSLFFISLYNSIENTVSPIYAIVLGIFFIIGVHDKIQKKHSVLRNYPVIGHFRYWIEYIAPELRQYIVESDNEETPFSRAQRSVVYQRSKGQTDVQAFGTKIDVMRRNYEWISHSMAPTEIKSTDFRIVVGENQKRPYSMSVFNISAMSFGSLSANAIRALNYGAAMGNFAHDTGEGSVSKYHREHKGDLIWEVASGYFGCRNEDGSFNENKFKKTASEEQIKMIEIKLSQGAKPGHGGVLPASKVTPEIAETRGVPMGKDCISPAAHSEFHNPKELVHFIEKLRLLSDGKPVGFKFCVGHPWDFFGICKAMIAENIYPDFIVVDGSEGGTGAAPMEFTDHMGTPLQEGLLLVHNTLVGLGIRNKIKIGASGKIISAFDMARTFALGADWVNSARGFLFSLGCIQALGCNTGKCPTGIATQDPERQKALVVPDKALRVFNFHKNTLHALQELLQAAGVHHPKDLQPHHVVRRVSGNEVALLSTLLPFLENGDLLKGNYKYPIYQNWFEKSRTDAFGINN